MNFKYSFVCFIIIIVLFGTTLAVKRTRGRASRRTSSSYNGEWDISARQQAILCVAIKQFQNNGSTFDPNEPIEEPKKPSYLRDGKCWKNAWQPSTEGDAEDRLGTSGALYWRRKVKGYYKMVLAPNTECP